MKIYICPCLPNGLEFGCVVVAEHEAHARMLVKEKFEKDGWEVTEANIVLKEVDPTKPSASIMDPINVYRNIHN